MTGYLIKRIFSIIPVLFVVSIVIFLIIQITPGDPAAVLLGEEASEEQIDALREELGLNLPLVQQYFNWLFDALQGNLGYSYFMKEPVLDTILSHLKPTISLAILAEALALFIAIPFGIAAARRRGTTADQSIMGAALLGMSIPSFLLGMLLILLFGVILRWFPIAGYQPIDAGLWEHLKYLILPAISLSTVQAALIVRMTRSSMLEVLNYNYIKTARSKGVKERNVIYRHALRNSFIPILTVIGQTFGALVTGAIVTETIFNIPGIGQIIINSIERRDYSVIQGVVLFVTLIYVVINLFIDLLYGVVDPRARLDR
ncbi:ABC transporter permease [Robertmurraya massiliosenegalensis]|uniref:ABC transporter permease n=1 Tax=Robertmurraya massiliosenegalensis TaxID=1287657 RepID=UPI00031B5179|nr:ABC transporter permease [Robertmurraya massiliosenegalensis]